MPQEYPASTNDRHGAAGSERQCRGGGKAGPYEQPDRRCDLEAGVLLLQEHARGRERVQAQESRSGEERERDEQDAGIAAPSCRLCHQEPDQEAERGREQHEPEVGRMMLPLDVQAGNAEEEEETRQRDGQNDGGKEGSPHSAARSSRS